MLPFFCFSYFSSISSFPQPLTPEEEKYYLEQLGKGSEEAKDILIERNLRLVAHIVKKYSNLNKDMDDLISTGTIGLIKSSKKEKNETSIHSPIGIDKEGNEISLLDVLFTESESIFDQVDFGIEIKKLYEKIGRVLKPREKLILRMRYGLDNTEEKTQREIAEQMGISRSYVSRIEKKALKKLYQELSKS